VIPHPNKLWLGVFQKYSMRQRWLSSPPEWLSGSPVLVTDSFATSVQQCTADSSGHCVLGDYVKSINTSLW
jgi:hypothetical protein